VFNSDVDHDSPMGFSLTDEKLVRSESDACDVVSNLPQCVDEWTGSRRMGDALFFMSGDKCSVQDVARVGGGYGVALPSCWYSTLLDPVAAAEQQRDVTDIESMSDVERELAEVGYYWHVRREVRRKRRDGLHGYPVMIHSDGALHIYEASGGDVICEKFGLGKKKGIRELASRFAALPGGGSLGRVHVVSMY